MIVKYKKLNDNARIPRFAHSSDAGADITAVKVVKKGNWIFPLYIYYTGLAFELPDDYWAILAARSSISKLLAWIANGIGVLDPSYRGEVQFRFRGFLWYKPYNVGDRVGQIIFVRKPKVMFVSSNKLSETSRSNGGFGSTGK